MTIVFRCPCGTHDLAVILPKQLTIFLSGPCACSHAPGRLFEIQVTSTEVKIDGRRVEAQFLRGEWVEPALDRG